jgi:hypothetical protein
MKNFTFLTILIAISSKFISAQTTVNDYVILDVQYANQSFYSMADGEKVNVSNNNWDLQFATTQRSASIRVNDGKDIQVYVLANPDTANWNNIDTTGMLPLYNADTSWEYGAFNNVGSRMHPDYGCMYYVGTGQLKGHRVFVIKLNNGAYKKFWVKYLDYYDYIILVGNIDNTNEDTIYLDKADYSSKNFVYYDLENMQVRDIEPAAEEWDIVFRKYYAMDSITFLPFNKVTGVLSNLHVETADIRGVPIASVNSDNGYVYSKFINTIGYDWKHYNYDSMRYDLDEDLGYFVKNQFGDVYKIVFTGFAGSSTGRIDFQKTNLSPAASVKDIQNSNLNMITVYPNPSSSFTNILVSMKKEKDISLSMFDISGKMVFNNNIATSSFEKGFYFVKVTDGNNTLTQKLLIAH